MTTLTLYHQVRVDGGERTGIEVSGLEVMHFFQEGSGEHDPALLWWVDLECAGQRLPTDAVGARAWFTKNQSFFVAALSQIADAQLNAGFDVDVRPYDKSFDSGPDESRVRIAISAIRRGGA